MGDDVSQDIGAQLSGISDEVERSMRHLDIGAWRSIIFETQVAVVAMAPAADDSLVVVAASRSTPLGLLRRLLDRCAERAAGWFESGRRP
jgi:predicted regulator of Ras-like GTPase activity (Roadblock/LC7/MglB family)